MLPSEKLRLMISKTYGIDLEKYAWSDELKQTIFSIQLDKYLETHANTLAEIYQQGFNIGHCGLTSRYIVRTLKDSNLHFGTSSLLIGTKSSPNGEHAWSVINDTLIDSTLMICISLDKAKELGYTTSKIISKESACMLSEYDVYDNDFYQANKNLNFTTELLEIKNLK